MKRVEATTSAFKLGGGNYRQAARRIRAQVCGPCAAYMTLSYVGSPSGYCGAGRWEFHSLERAVESLKPAETVDLLLDVLQALFARGVGVQRTVEPYFQGAAAPSGVVMKLPTRVACVTRNGTGWMVGMFTTTGWDEGSCYHAEDEPNIPAVTQRIRRDLSGWL